MEKCKKGLMLGLMNITRSSPRIRQGTFREATEVIDFKSSTDFAEH